MDKIWPERRKKNHSVKQRDTQFDYCVCWNAFLLIHCMSIPRDWYWINFFLRPTILSSSGGDNSVASIQFIAIQLVNNDTDYYWISLHSILNLFSLCNHLHQVKINFIHLHDIQWQKNIWIWCKEKIIQHFSKYETFFWINHDLIIFTKCEIKKNLGENHKYWKAPANNELHRLKCVFDDT